MPEHLSRKRIEKIGRALRDGVLEPGTSLWNDYAGFLAECHVIELELKNRIEELLPETLSVTSRTKSTDTLRQKLTLHPDIPLRNINDVVGIRIVGPFNLDEQDGLVRFLSTLFDGRKQVIDRRADPRSGYRAVHLVVHGYLARVEIQIRTRIQAEWADLYEGIADRWGRQIRYGGRPDPDPSGDYQARQELIALTQELSLEAIKAFEESEAAIPRTLASHLELADDVESLAQAISISQASEARLRGLISQLGALVRATS